MQAKAIFFENGIPRTGLLPTIKIYKLSDGELVVNGAPMIEVGGGCYRYPFIGYSPTDEYYVLCDSVVLAAQERFVVSIISQFEGQTATQSNMTTEIYNLHGLDSTKPLVVTTTGRFAGEISQSITTNAQQTTIVRV